MKKSTKFLFLLSLAMMMVAGSANAQKTHFGIKASATFNNIITDSITYSASDTSFFGTDQNPLQFGFNVGAFAEYMLSDKFGVSVEVLYARQGRKEINETDIYKSTTNITTNNINLPIMLKLYLTERLAVEIGPQFNYCFGGNINVKTSFTDELLTDQESNFTFKEIEDDFSEVVSDYKYWNRFGVGAALGFSYNFNFGLFVGARYTLGFTNLLNSINDEDKQESMDSKNSVISISAGFRF